MAEPIPMFGRSDSDEASRLRMRLDSFRNVSTGVGGLFDKRTGGMAQVRLFDYQYWADLYRGNDMAGRIVDAAAEDMCREGWHLAVEDDAEIIEAITQEDERLETEATFLQALKWERAFGGAGIFVGANDGQTADQPLNEDKIKSIDFLLPLDTLELVPNSYYVDPLKPKYGLPATYRLNRFGTITPVLPEWMGGLPSRKGLAALQGGPTLKGGGLGAALGAGDWNFLPIVHESRIIRFGGVFINRLQLRQQRYWGDSIFVRAEEVLRDFGLSWASAGILMQDFAQAVVKMKGMAQLQAKSGPKAFADAAAMIEASRSTANALILDAEDSFERSRTPMEGLPQMLGMFSQRLAATVDMPVSRLMGIAPTGLNNDDDTGQDWWFDKVKAGQRTKLQPRLRAFYRLLFLSKTGPTEGRIPDNWSTIFNPLKQLSPTEEATRRKTVADADHIYVTDGVVTPEEVAATRFGKDEYNGEKIELLEADPEKRALAAAELAEQQAPEEVPSGEDAPLNPGAPDRQKKDSGEEISTKIAYHGNMSEYHKGQKSLARKAGKPEAAKAHETAEIAHRSAATEHYLTSEEHGKLAGRVATNEQANAATAKAREATAKTPAPKPGTVGHALLKGAQETRGKIASREAAKGGSGSSVWNEEDHPRDETGKFS